MREGWEYKKLGDSCVIEYGTRVVQKKDGGTIYPVYGGGGETFRMDKYNRELSCSCKICNVKDMCTLCNWKVLPK